MSRERSRHFVSNLDGDPPPTGLPIEEYIDRMWSALGRHGADVPPHGSFLRIAGQYVVPGRRFTEIYWDSYFSMIDLEERHRYELSEALLSVCARRGNRALVCVKARNSPAL